MSSAMPPINASQSETSVDKPLGELMGDVVAELGTLVRQEIALAKLETKEELSKAGKVAGMASAAVVAGHMALIFLSLGLAWVMSQAVNRALAFALVGVLYAAAAGLLAVMAKKQAQTIRGRADRQ
jgi:uncharacterized membrane protein YqjE